ncbi:MAG: hypothetical protein ACLR4Z_02200 [Butyricicoccaceae bacterium]
MARAGAGRGVRPCHPAPLPARRDLPFARLFDRARNRSEIVATFLAVLELSRTHRIRLHGEGEDIELTLNDEKGSETRDTTGEHA